MAQVTIIYFAKRINRRVAIQLATLWYLLLVRRFDAWLRAEEQLIVLSSSNVSNQCLPLEMIRDLSVVDRLALCNT